MSAGTRRKLDRVLVLLVAGQLVGLVALVIAIIGLENSLGNRRVAARDSCRLLVGLVHAATTDAPNQRTAAQLYIKRTPLRDCNFYARHLVK